MTEAEIQQRIRLACSTPMTRLFRNNVGACQDKTGRLIRYGLAPGSSDLIGWRAVTITPDMVGQTVAVFAALEIKSARGSPTDEQLNFLGTVQSFGGIGGIVRSVDEAKLLLRLDP